MARHMSIYGSGIVGENPFTTSISLLLCLVPQYAGGGVTVVTDSGPRWGFLGGLYSPRWGKGIPMVIPFSGFFV